MMNIVTSICVDQNDRSYNYQLYYQDNEEKRKTYWKCAVTFFASAKRIYPEHRYILFTNDDQPVFIQRMDVRKFLKKLGVDIRIKEYTFRPPAKFSHYLSNNFYKFETIKYLAKEDRPSVLFDSDVFFTRRDNQLVKIIEDGKTLLYDVYQKTDPEDRSNNGISRRDQELMFKEIDPQYPVPNPKFWGGEIISGDAAVFKAIDEEFERVFNYVITNYESPPVFPNTRSFLDGNETIGNFVFNKVVAEWVEASSFIKRIWPLKKINNVTPDVVRLPIWHMISEKDKGIPLLFREAVQSSSRFWTSSDEDFGAYLGEYLGVPERLHDYDKPKLYKTIMPRVKNKIGQYKRLIFN